jgi:hypothetical protein
MAELKRNRRDAEELHARGAEENEVGGGDSLIPTLLEPSF